MGHEKDRLIEAEDRWLMKAKAERLKCSVCGDTIPYADRELYFATGKCSRCGEWHDMLRENN